MEFGFILTRHVIDSTTNEYWQEAYRTIRTYYTEPIIIIDDGSDPIYVNSSLQLVNCNIIVSGFVGRGEILPYYYFYKLRPFDYAVIIHDSIFFNRKVDFQGQIPCTCKFLWSFSHECDDDTVTIPLLSSLAAADGPLEVYYRKMMWVGCFGAMTFMQWNFLNTLVDRHNLFESLLPRICNRDDRMAFERIIAVIDYANDLTRRPSQCSFFGDIFRSYPFGSTYQQYKDGHLAAYDIAKIWTGR